MAHILLRVSLVATLVMLSGCASLADRLINQTIIPPPYAPTADAERLHRPLFVADLHADTLLWPRDLLERAPHGHVDVPRLREGNVGLQVFGVVTRVPLFLGLDDNSDRPDVITALVQSQDWPPPTHTSRMAARSTRARSLRTASGRRPAHCA